MIKQPTMSVSLRELKENFTKQVTVFSDYINSLSKIDIATLGPKGTSSEATGAYLLSLINREDATCSVYPSYETAMESVTSGKSNLLLMANAYCKIDKAYMCSKLNLLLAFEYQTPVYGLAKKNDHQLLKERTLKIATHHAPSSLIPWFLNGFTSDYKVVLVESTSQAAIMTQQGVYDMCVTNSNAVQAYDLEFMSPTRPIRMVWSVFGLV